MLVKNIIKFEYDYKDIIDKFASKKISLEDIRDMCKKGKIDPISCSELYSNGPLQFDKREIEELSIKEIKESI